MANGSSNGNGHRPAPHVEFAVESILGDFDLASRPSFPALLEHLYQSRFQGPVVFHFAGGIPRMVEFQQALQVPLASAPKK